MNEIQKQGLITTVKGVAIGNGCWGTVAGTNCGDVGGEHHRLLAMFLAGLRFQTDGAAFAGHPGTVYKIDAEYYAGRGLISPVSKTIVGAVGRAARADETR